MAGTDQDVLTLRIEMSAIMHTEPRKSIAMICRYGERVLPHGPALPSSAECRNVPLEPIKTFSPRTGMGRFQRSGHGAEGPLLPNLHRLGKREKKPSSHEWSNSAHKG